VVTYQSDDDVPCSPVTNVPSGRLSAVHERPSYRNTGLTELPPPRLAFFDDLEENVAGARQAGLQAWRVSRPGEILDALAR